MTEILSVFSPSKIEINSHSLRDKEYSIKKPEDSIRIITLGNSITFGYGLNLSETYHQRLEEKLNQSSSKKVQVLNFGIIGFNTKKEVNYLKENLRGLDQTSFYYSTTTMTPST